MSLLGLLLCEDGGIFVSGLAKVTVDRHLMLNTMPHHFFLIIKMYVRGRDTDREKEADDRDLPSSASLKGLFRFLSKHFDFHAPRGKQKWPILNTGQSCLKMILGRGGRNLSMT